MTEFRDGDKKPDAYMDGWFAQKFGISCEANPYDLRQQNRSYHHWTIGFSSRYNAVKRDLPLDLDDGVL